MMSRYALQLLDQDPSTEIIILLSKPPHPEVRQRLNETIKKLQTKVIVYFQGDMAVPGGEDQAETLDGAAELAVSLLNNKPYNPEPFEVPGQVKQLLDSMGGVAGRHRIVGLFTGGTLAKEAQLLIHAGAGEVSNNIDEEHKHIVVDLGEDEYTVGKPHPMLAPENRTEVLLDLAAKGKLGNCGVLLFDLVLGDGSHLDPAAELVAGLELLNGRYGISIPVVAAVIGTEKDPQSMSDQIRVLQDSGAAVFIKNSEAARFSAILADPAERASLLEV